VLPFDEKVVDRDTAREDGAHGVTRPTLGDG